MDELKKSLEVVLQTLKGLQGKDQLVIFLFVRSVLEYVESCLVTGDEYDIAEVFTDCCNVFQEADDVLVEKNEDSVKVKAIKDGKVEKSYNLLKQSKGTQTAAVTEDDKGTEVGDQTGEEGDTDGMYYLSIPGTEEGAEGSGDGQVPQSQEPQASSQQASQDLSEEQQAPETVLECSDPSVLQAFLEEGGKLPSYLPPGTQIIIETKDGRTEVIQNTTVVQSDVLDPRSVKQEASMEAGGPDIPVFVMSEDGNMLVPADAKPPNESAEAMATVAAAAAEATPILRTPRGRGRPRKRPLVAGVTMGTKKIKVEDGSESDQLNSSGLTFQCDQCFQYFAHEHSLHRHYRAVHMNMKWSCEDCGREFTRPDSLVNHKKKQSCFKGPGKPTVRFDPNEKFVEGQGYLCDLCNIFFRNMGGLKRHRETQHNGIVHECEDCGKKFTASSYLSTHKRQNCIARSDRTIKTEDAPEDRTMLEGEEEESGSGGQELNSMELSLSQEMSPVVKAESQETEDSKSISSVSSIKKTKREPGEILPKDPNDVFLCEDCGKCLSSKQALIIHMRKHTGEVPFKCQFCGHGANTRGNLLRHLESIHGVTKDDPNIKLDLTNYAADASSVASGNDRFLINTSQSDMFAIDTEVEPNMLGSFCPDSIDRHRDDSPEGQTRLMAKDSCPQTLESLVQELQNSGEGTKSTETSPQIQGLSVVTPYYIDKKTDQGTTMLSVNFKDNTISSSQPSTSTEGKRTQGGTAIMISVKDLMKKHCGRPRTQDSDVSQGEPMCPICNKKFHNHSNLTVHMRIHTKELPHSCDYCDHCFATKANKIRHEQTVHQHRKDWACDECEKRFTEKKTLMHHKQVCHQGERPHQCHICEKTFSYKAALQTHISGHTGEKPHQCEFCEQGFTLKSQLRSHMKTVHPDEDLSCPVCDKPFVKNADLEKHMKVHEDLEKKCQLCNSSFNLKQELTDHIKAVHTKEKPFKCSVCENVGFYSKNALIRHMENEHSDSQVEDKDSSQPFNGDSVVGNDTCSLEDTEYSEPDNTTLEMSVDDMTENEAGHALETVSVVFNVKPESEEMEEQRLEIKMEPPDIATPVGKTAHRAGRSQLQF